MSNSFFRVDLIIYIYKQQRKYYYDKIHKRAEFNFRVKLYEIVYCFACRATLLAEDRQRANNIVVVVVVVINAENDYNYAVSLYAEPQVQTAV